MHTHAHPSDWGLGKRWSIASACVILIFICRPKWIENFKRKAQFANKFIYVYTCIYLYNYNIYRDIYHRIKCGMWNAISQYPISNFQYYFCLWIHKKKQKKKRRVRGREREKVLFAARSRRGGRKWAWWWPHSMWLDLSAFDGCPGHMCASLRVLVKWPNPKRNQMQIIKMKFNFNRKTNKNLQLQLFTMCVCVCVWALCDLK